MKTNKGVIGIGLILAIVLGIVVVGGGAYYLGNNNFFKKVDNSVVSIEENLQSEKDKISKNIPNDNEEKDLIKSVTLDLSSDIAKKYKTEFTEALKKSANFNEHYVVVSWGCGSGCLSYGIVDKLTGKVYQGPTDDYGNTGDYYGDENFNKTRWSVNSNIFKTIGYTSIDSYKFENEKFTKIGSNSFPCASMGCGNNSDFKNPPISEIDTNLIKLTSCGISFSKTSNWSVISNNGNEVVLDIPSTDHIVGTSGINIKCVLDNKITDTDAKFGNITYYYDSNANKWMVSMPNERDGGVLPATVATPLFTVNDLPVFRGTGRWLTYIIPVSTNSILSLNEGDTEGGYTQTLTNLVKTIKKL